MSEEPGREAAYNGTIRYVEIWLHDMRLCCENEWHFYGSMKIAMHFIQIKSMAIFYFVKNVWTSQKMEKGEKTFTYENGLK